MVFEWCMSTRWRHHRAAVCRCGTTRASRRCSGCRASTSPRPSWPVCCRTTRASTPSPSTSWATTSRWVLCVDCEQCVCSHRFSMCRMKKLTLKDGYVVCVFAVRVVHALSVLVMIWHITETTSQDWFLWRHRAGCYQSSYTWLICRDIFRCLRTGTWTVETSTRNSGSVCRKHLVYCRLYIAYLHFIGLTKLCLTHHQNSTCNWCSLVTTCWFFTPLCTSHQLIGS